MRALTARTLLMSIFLTTSACSASVSVGGSGSVDKAEIEKQGKAFLEDQGGVTAGYELTCPDDLDAEEDAEMTCTIVYESGHEQDLFVSVTSVDGSDVNFHFETGEVSEGTGDDSTDTGS